MRPKRASRALDPGGRDLRRSCRLAVLAGDAARGRRAPTAGRRSAPAAGSGRPVRRPTARPGLPGTLVPGGGMKCGGKSIWVPVCSVSWYALTRGDAGLDAAADPVRAAPALEPGERDDLELGLVGERDRVLLAGRHREVEHFPGAARERAADHRRGGARGLCLRGDAPFPKARPAPPNSPAARAERRRHRAACLLNCPIGCTAMRATGRSRRRSDRRRRLTR